MTEPVAALECEHHYAYRILGGHPINVGVCVLCHTPNWDDLMEQAAELYRWGWQEGRDGKPARQTLTAYDKPRDNAAGDGPTVRDCAADDRRWPLEKAGE